MFQDSTILGTGKTTSVATSSELNSVRANSGHCVTTTVTRDSCDSEASLFDIDASESHESLVTVVVTQWIHVILRHLYLILILDVGELRVSYCLDMRCIGCGMDMSSMCSGYFLGCLDLGSLGLSIGDLCFNCLLASSLNRIHVMLLRLAQRMSHVLL